MVEGDNRELRSIAWLEIFPWLCIFRTFRLAISLRVLVFSATAALLTVSGWSLFGLVFSGTNDPAVAAAGDSVAVQKGDPAVLRNSPWLGPYRRCPWTALTGILSHKVSLLPGGSLSSRTDAIGSDPLVGVWTMLSRPLHGVFRTEPNVSSLACLVLCGLWAVAVWAFFGAAITRIAAVQLASDERVGWGAAIRYARSKWLAYFSAPIFPLIGIALAAVPGFLLGWLLRMDVGVLLFALAWPVLLILGLLMAILLLGLVFGWPLMWSTISAEGTDSFDALSRSYAYVFQRPLHYLFYVVVAALFGVLGWLLVSNFATAVIDLAWWAASWGSGHQDGVSRAGLIAQGAEAWGGLGGAGATLIRFWSGCVSLLAVGFLFGYFWTASTSIYFLLRRDVDATEMDEVFLDADRSEETFGLPTVTTDAAGAPVVEDDIPEVEPDATDDD